ncbi:unnamed protein product [Clonostachys rhizophaga]|uniref:Zn(2)-C6 fungal-type domain-containing protein n=1 Tax=Clonostachys rhizophaga TaxID=160324 RepID=A0A9N9VM04_9HYPO|nr:unnamed protein product [Clonostachys rhizophaga]
MPSHDRHPNRSSTHRRPASCLSCKSRKLRCSRESPCSNCVSRNVSCQQPAPKSRPARVTATNRQLDVTSPDILERLLRLENILAERPNIGTTLRSPGSGSVAPEADNAQSPRHSLGIMPKIQDLEADAVSLEKLCKVQSSLGSALSDSLTFKVCTLSQLTNPITYIFQPSASSFGIANPVKCIWIPEHSETTLITDKFVEDIDYIRHIIYLPSLQPTIDDLYRHVDLRDDAVTGPLALLLSIIATVRQNWTSHDLSHAGLFPSSPEAKQQTTSWVKAILDLIDYSARVGSNSLQHVQALLHTCYVLFHLEGFSTQLRSVFGTTVTFARNLGLHVIDLPVNMDYKPNTRSSVLAAEMGRRVWWSVVTLDWYEYMPQHPLLAQHCYPRADFYLMHPKQMAVNRPRDCSDDDIERNEAPDRGLSPMTFHILKIRLAELCREHAEHTFLGGGLYSEMRYGHVMHSDAELNRFTRELAPAFQLGPDASFQDRGHDCPPPRVLATQAYMLNLSIQAQLCKLHLPYLFRAAVDPAVDYSRKACLRAAQQIIRIELALEKRSCPPFLPNMTRHCGVLYIICLACIVLLLDRCLGSAAGRHETPLRETLEAYRVLKNASEYSPTAQKLFNSLVHLLSKHRVSLPANQSTTEKEMDGLNSGENGRASSDIIRVPGAVNPAEVALVNEMPQEQLSDGLWQGPENGIDIDDFDWKALFAGIDSSFI